MKSFRGYLQEKFQDWKSGDAPAWTESLSTMLFDLPRAGLKDIYKRHQNGLKVCLPCCLICEELD